MGRERNIIWKGTSKPSGVVVKSEGGHKIGENPEKEGYFSLKNGK